MRFKIYDFQKHKELENFRVETKDDKELGRLKCRDNAICKTMVDAENKLQEAVSPFTSKSYRYEIEVIVTKIKRPKEL